jgi:nucleoside-diphosphate-sugar epimerase
MLGLAKRIGARFLLTSTSEVYGDPLQHPQVETYWGNVNPIGKSSSPTYSVSSFSFVSAIVLTVLGSSLC